MVKKPGSTWHSASGKTIKQIAEDLCLSVKTISTNRTRALKKMEMENNAEFTYYAIKHGLVTWKKGFRPQIYIQVFFLV